MVNSYLVHVVPQLLFWLHLTRLSIFIY